MHLIFLGTASCYPTAHRAVSCTALRFDDGNVWLFDCGEGSQVQIQKSSIQPGKIKKIFITHLHGDHLFGLPGMMCSLGTQLQERKDDFVLDVYGPVGLRRYLRETLKLSRSPLSFNYRVHELVPPESINSADSEKWGAPLYNSPPHLQESVGETIFEIDGSWKVIDEDKVKVFAAPLIHRIPCFGFVIKESPMPGSLDAPKLLKEGIQPGPLFKKIKCGEPITLESGKIIYPEDVLGPEKPGRIITILGDTCDSSAISELALNSDILVHEATVEDSLKDKAIENGHSTPSMAATFAGLIRAKTLILFHFSQRYRREGDLDNPKDSNVSILYNEAKETCDKNGIDCDIILADDLLELEVKRPLAVK